MNLEKKFLRLEDNTTFYWNGYWDQRMTDDEVLPHAKKCVQICDEFAVGFAYWITDPRNENVKGSIAIEELLEIYKQGL